MAVELKMPKMGLTMSTADVAKWLKKEGEAVKKGEPVAEVMTDKLTNNIEAPADGVLIKIVAPAGAKLEAGGLLAYIGQPGEAIPDSPAAPAAASGAAAPLESAAPSAPPPVAASGERVLSTPAARALAKDKNFDLSTVKGTGPGGRITKEDVEAALAASPPVPSPAGETAPPSAGSPVVAEDQVDDVLERRPYSGLRLAIGSNMHKSWTEIPRVTLHTQVAVDNLMALRQKINAKAEPMDRVSVSDLMIKLICAALKIHPELNARFDGQEMKVMRHVNLGVAVALEDGLMVPVIKKADLKSLKIISAELKDLAFRAKNGQIKLDEMSGGTITVSNLGGYGSVDTFNPIINPPEVAIIGLGRSRRMPWIIDGEVAQATVMSISVTHDHRVLDGAPVAAFMATLNQLIDDPMPGVI